MCNFDRDVVATLNLFKSGCGEFHLELMKSDTGETGEPLKVAVTVYPLNHLEGRTE